METETIITKSEEETEELGFNFAKRLKPGDVISLVGDLGTGKTSFIKGVCNYFEVEEIITSPTFTIVNQYNGQLDGAELPIYHIDLYRIKEAKELDEIGFCDCVFATDSIKLIEWADKSFDMIPDYAHSIQILANDDNEEERIVKIKFNLNETKASE